MSTTLEEPQEQAHGFEFQVSTWNRVMSAAKLFLLSGFLVWTLVMFALQVAMLPNLRARMRMRLALGIALPAAALLAGRRYLTAVSSLKVEEDRLEVISPLRTIELNPLAVDGLVAVDGLSFSGKEVVVWKKLVLLVDGRKYTLACDPAVNETSYFLLRQHCVHAWGLPFSGELETPLAGPELSAEEYANSLLYVQRHYLLQTQQGALNGLLMVLGSATAGFVIVANLAARPKLGKALLWIGIFAFAGVMVIARSFRQMTVFYKIRNVQRRLREAA